MLSNDVISRLYSLDEGGIKILCWAVVTFPWKVIPLLLEENRSSDLNDIIKNYTKRWEWSEPKPKLGGIKQVIGNVVSQVTTMTKTKA